MVSQGSNRAKTERAKEPANSLLATAKLPMPNVDIEDMLRKRTVLLWIMPAAPPPAIAASVQVRNGDMPLTTTNFGEVLQYLADTRSFIDNYQAHMRAAAKSETVVE